MKTLIILMAIFFMQGCATAYQSGSGSLTGGHYNAKISNTLEKIVFSANGFTAGVTAQEYALYRCAEYANENKMPFFVMYPSLRAAAMDKPVLLPVLGSVGGKPAAFSYVLLSDKEQFGSLKTSDIMKRLDDIKNQSSAVKPNAANNGN